MCILDTNGFAYVTPNVYNILSKKLPTQNDFS